MYNIWDITMDFGKLPSVEKVDFTMPPEPAQNAAVLRNLPPRPGSPRILIGSTGYNMKSWVGKWYPANAKDKDFLRHYGKQFDTIEFNATHYRIPDYATVLRWYDDTPDDFKFSPKIPQTISHDLDLGLSSGQIPVFCTAIRDLREKLGCSFLQLPPYFSPRDTSMLFRFLDVFPTDLPLAVEVRHPEFFEPTDRANAFFAALQARNIATVITDVAGRRDACHLHLTNARVLIRFVGNSLHATDYSRVAAWAEQISTWFTAGLHEVYFFCHEPDNLLSPELAAFCAQTFVEKMPDVHLRGPKPIEKPAQQGVLF